MAAIGASQAGWVESKMPAELALFATIETSQSKVAVLTINSLTQTLSSLSVNPTCSLCK